MDLRRDIFQGIADPTRRAILTLLATQAMTAGAIAAEFNSARSTVSKHIQILVECELVSQTQKGREMHYYLQPDKMKEIADWLKPFQKVWESRFSKLDTILKKSQKK
ncbi:MAG: metalloregulator ArsR/SmtB family transcription factor [Bacteroidota bacterium]